jgi:hypothetical protein
MRGPRLASAAVRQRPALRPERPGAAGSSGSSAASSRPAHAIRSTAWASAALDPAVEAYINDGTLPAPGTSCKQEVPFVQPQQTAQALKVSPLVNLQPRPHMKSLPAMG